ncbi:hypothetical protein Tco_0633199 [Tanacetum coccineum]
MLKVSPWKGVIRFGKKGKLAPRYVGPFEILERIGPVAYRLRLPEELSGVHDTFHVSNLKKCLADASLHVPLDDIKIDKTLRFVEELVEILDRKVKSLKHSKIALVKVRWNSKRGPEFTWEREDYMKSKYPQLFVDRADESASIGNQSIECDLLNEIGMAVKLVSFVRILRLREVARVTVRIALEFTPEFVYVYRLDFVECYLILLVMHFSVSLLLTPLCCDDIHDVTPRVSALAGMSPPIHRKYHDSVAFATGCKRIKNSKLCNRKIRIPIVMWPCSVKEKMTLKEVDGHTVEEIETKIIAKDGTITRVPRKFQGYKTSEEESVEQPRRHDLYGFVDHPQLQHWLPQSKDNMNGWLLEDEDEVDSDLESTASSKPVWEKTTKDDHDRASHNCPWCSK